MFKTNKYLEVVNIQTREVVKRMDVSNKTERQIDKIETGILMTMNLKDYHTRITESDIELGKVG